MVRLTQRDLEAGADGLVGGVAVVVLTSELDDEAAGFERGFFSGHAKRPAVRVERELLPVPARRDHPHGGGDIEAVEFDDGLDGEVVALAGCGADAAPFFRVFNPTAQGEKFDPDGVYVRRWVPELSQISNVWIFEPWRMPPQMKLPAARQSSKSPGKPRQ